MKKVTITFNGTLEFRVPEVKGTFENERTAESIEMVLEKDMRLTDPHSLATVIVSDISVVPDTERRDNWFPDTEKWHVSETDLPEIED